MTTTTLRTATQIRFRDEVLEDLTKYSHQLGLSRNQLIENMIDSGLDDLKVLEKSGALSFGVVIRDMAENIRRGSQPLES